VPLIDQPLIGQCDVDACLIKSH